jgi:hypothetical protein
MVALTFGRNLALSRFSVFFRLGRLVSTWSAELGFLLVCPFLSCGRLVSDHRKSVPSVHIRWMTTASRRARARLGVFNKIFAALAKKSGKPERIVIDAAHLKAHRTAASLPRGIGQTKGGLNSKLLVVCDGAGRPLIMLLSEGQMSDFKGTALVLSALPKAKELLAD